MEVLRYTWKQKNVDTKNNETQRHLVMRAWQPRIYVSICALGKGKGEYVFFKIIFYAAFCIYSTWHQKFALGWVITF